MKTGFLQILYDIHFGGLYHEDLYTHLTKFYEISGKLGVQDTEEEAVFLGLFSNLFFGK